MVPGQGNVPMSEAVLALALLSAAIWLYLILFRGGFWRARSEPLAPEPVNLPDVVAVVPARDEAETIADTIGSLLRQAYRGRFDIVLVDDHSSDGTAEIARRAAGESPRLHVVPARALPAGWSGKLWAVSEGLAAAERLSPGARYVLMTDADIVHAPDSLLRLVARGEAHGLDLVSLMVRLRCTSWAERAFVPAFVFFFAMLYPFAWVRRGDRATAAAAGGCMLVRRSALDRIGGIEAIRGQLIDDCALATAIKGSGGAIWLDLADDTVSLRRYERAADVWTMIARSAFTQLRYSSTLLVVAALGMLTTFLAPPVLALLGTGAAASLGALAWLAMAAAYLPMLRYYGAALWWAPLLPLIALFYLGATLDSARQHWLGRGGRWKGRDQSRLVAGSGR